ncbi:MAG: RNB domain-containing ribonuclease [Actinomycetota bacterium]|nr:RNB domain-containing ribonuclease [Actinomycetota bacterium]
MTPDNAGGFVGVVVKRGRFHVVEPLFERGGRLPLERGKVRTDAGQMVLAKPSSRGVRAARVLGSPKRARDVVEALLWEGLERRGFARRVEDDASDASDGAAEVDPTRRDLRDLATFTVDPATARDFDDAVSAQPDGDGARLWIHIADVAAHVRPGSILDVEASRRATSVYAPGVVEPMLPAALSNEACSLVPGEDRLAVTVEVRLDGAGAPRSASFYRSTIRSDARLDYDGLDCIFAGKEEPPALVAEPLRLAREAAASLAERRPRGALEVESFEPEFEFDSEGDVVGAKSVPQTEAHELIEHLMILTNEQVADLLEKRGSPALYRVHEQPDPARVERLLDQLEAVKVPAPGAIKNMSPTEAGDLVGEISRWVAREARRRGHGAQPLGSLVLRSLKQAYYTEKNLGHAGLGSAAYAHFTSPIRRYPDLIAHRSLMAVVGAGESAPDPSDVRAAGPWCSEREREAMKIERRADSVCAAFLLERELFERGWSTRFDGEVSGVINAGAFIRFRGELGDVYEGFVPARTLKGERFELNETETALVGRRTGREVGFGDEMRVTVTGVEAARGRTDLEVSHEHP